jgi:hypothetical protein
MKKHCSSDQVYLCMLIYKNNGWNTTTNVYLYIKKQDARRFIDKCLVSSILVNGVEDNILKIWLNCQMNKYNY